MYGKIGLNTEWGEGYIIIPETENRQQYIRRCYNTNTVILFTDMQGVFQNVIVGKQDFEILEFPDKPKKLGTKVLWVREPNTHHIYILKILNTNPYTGSGSGQSVGNVDGKNTASTTFSAIKGTILTSIQHVTNAIYKIVIKSPNKTALYRTEVAGSIESESEHFLVKSNAGLQLICDDSTIDLDDNEMKFNAEKITMGMGNEAMIKGTTLINFLEDFIKELESTTVNTAFGQMNLINKEKIGKFKTLLNDLASQLIYIS